jgi:methionine sulfoxide reductase heme-binding subunit
MTLWMTARGAGLAALTLMTVSVCGGAFAHSIKTPSVRLVVQYMHRAGAALGLGVLVLHILTIVADSYAGVGVTGAIIPFTSGYRATWVGLGTIAAYLFVAVATLGFARVRMAGSERGAAIWRKVHGLAYGGWAIALVHGFMSGTDSSVTWVRGLYLVCLIAGGAAIAARLAAQSPPSPAPVQLVREATHR